MDIKNYLMKAENKYSFSWTLRTDISFAVLRADRISFFPDHNVFY